MKHVKPKKDPGVWKAVLGAMGGDVAAMNAGQDPENVVALKAAGRQFASNARKMFKDKPVSERLFLAFVSGAYWQASRAAAEDDVK